MPKQVTVVSTLVYCSTMLNIYVICFNVQVKPVKGKQHQNKMSLEWHENGIASLSMDDCNSPWLCSRLLFLPEMGVGYSGGV